MFRLANQDAVEGIAVERWKRRQVDEIIFSQLQRNNSVRGTLAWKINFGRLRQWQLP